MKKLRYRIEAAALSLLFTAFRLLPLDLASYIGGFMARAVGPFFRAHKTAKQNLKMVFPTFSDRQIQTIVTRMWDNLGRVAAELPSIASKTLYNRATIEGTEHLPKPGQPVIFVSGHFGNWELTYPILYQQGLPTTLVYRHLNNPYADKIIANIRLPCSGGIIPKGPRGAIRMAHTLKKGNPMAMLIDQKMNDGIAVPFFGKDAMTATAVAQFALRYNLPIIPARVVRTKGAHFKATVFPPLLYEKSGDEERDVHEIMTRLNAVLEGWIREYPEQWFWVHKRWPEKK